MEEILYTLGITSREATVYITLNKLGPSSIRTIAQETSINRGTVHETLKSLARKGLVVYSPKGKQKLATAQDPEFLMTLAQEKKEEAVRAVSELERAVIPKLRDQTIKDQVADVRYYEGDEGVEHILRDVLCTTKREYCVYSSKPVRKYMYRNFPHFTKQRVRKGISVRVIAIGDGGEEAGLSQRKWIKNPSNLSSTSYVIIYPPKYAIISVTNEDYPFGVVITEESMAQTQKMLFDELWRKL
jgi:sugar-specific transcriptional regulator TrmB